MKPRNFGAMTERAGLPDQERKRLNEISRDIIGAAIKIHTILGLGLLENAYEACLEHELRLRKTQGSETSCLAGCFRANGS